MLIASYYCTSAKGTLHNTLLIITFAQLITTFFFSFAYYTVQLTAALASSLYAHIKRILNLNVDGMVIFVFLHIINTNIFLIGFNTNLKIDVCTFLYCF